MFWNSEIGMVVSRSSSQNSYVWCLVGNLGLMLGLYSRQMSWNSEITVMVSRSSFRYSWICMSWTSEIEMLIVRIRAWKEVLILCSRRLWLGVVRPGSNFEIKKKCLFLLLSRRYSLFWSHFLLLRNDEAYSSITSWCLVFLILFVIFLIVLI